MSLFTFISKSKKTFQPKLGVDKDEFIRRRNGSGFIDLPKIIKGVIFLVILGFFLLGLKDLAMASANFNFKGLTDKVITFVPDIEGIKNHNLVKLDQLKYHLLNGGAYVTDNFNDQVSGVLRKQTNLLTIAHDKVSLPKKVTLNGLAYVSSGLDYKLSEISHKKNLKLLNFQTKVSAITDKVKHPPLLLVKNLIKFNKGIYNYFNGHLIFVFTKVGDFKNNLVRKADQGFWLAGRGVDSILASVSAPFGGFKTVAVKITEPVNKTKSSVQAYFSMTGQVNSLVKNREELLLENQTSLRAGLVALTASVNMPSVADKLLWLPRSVGSSLNNLSYLNNETDKFLMATAVYSVDSVASSWTKSKQILSAIVWVVPSKVVAWFKNLPDLNPSTLFASIVDNWYNFLFAKKDIPNNTSPVASGESSNSATPENTDALREQIRQEVISELEGKLNQVFTNLGGSSDQMATTPSSSNSKDGIIVLPDQGDSAGTKNKLNSMFSDQVDIQFDQDGRSGVISPQFKDGNGDNYVFLLTPLQ